MSVSQEHRLRPPGETYSAVEMTVTDLVTKEVINPGKHIGRDHR